MPIRPRKLRRIAIVALVTSGAVVLVVALVFNLMPYDGLLKHRSVDQVRRFAVSVPVPAYVPKPFEGDSPGALDASTWVSRYFRLNRITPSLCADELEALRSGGWVVVQAFEAGPPAPYLSSTWPRSGGAVATTNFQQWLAGGPSAEVDCDPAIGYLSVSVSEWSGH